MSYCPGCGKDIGEPAQVSRCGPCVHSQVSEIAQLKEEKDSLEYAYENVKFQRDDLQRQCDSLREQYNHMKDLRDNLQRDIDGWKRYVKDNEICPHGPWVNKKFHEKTVRALEDKLEGAENLKKLNKIQGIVDE